MERSRLIRKSFSNRIKGLYFLTGFTLLEIMVSVAILSVGLTLILQGFAHSLNVLRISQDNLEATLLAENKMAEMQIQAKEDWDTFAGGADEQFSPEGSNINYVWKMEVEPVKSSEDSAEEFKNLNEVRITLAWKEGVRRRGRISVVTYIRKPEKQSKI